MTITQGIGLSTKLLYSYDKVVHSNPNPKDSSAVVLGDDLWRTES